MGICGVDQASSLEMLILQHEIISYIEKANRNLSFEEDIFAIDLINEVGPKGSFLNKQHTREHFKKELWFPTLLDRSYFNAWYEKGANNMEQRCEKRKNLILNRNEQEPLANDLVHELENIVEMAKINLTKSE
jgi:trimethylamine--corrinoid protein Co-methyltransferase